MLAIIDYKAGNLTSVKLALDSLGIEAEVTSDKERILQADHVIFPGVGAAASAMQTLKELDLIATIKAVFEQGTPFMGICLGCQIILEHSEEDNGTDCIGLIPGTVSHFKPINPLDKIPQIGWNSVELLREHPVLDGIDNSSEFYFVHSYYPAPSSEANILGRTDYAGASFASILVNRNLIATQFHPEKSGRIGLKLLDNFCKWKG